MYELVFVGGATAQGAYRLPRRYRRIHRTYEEAEAEARRVLGIMVEQGMPAAAHPAIIYGPGCGPDGRTISW